MKNQRGYLNMSGWDFLFIIIMLMVMGWAIIEVVMWIASHIHIAWL